MSIEIRRYSSMDGPQSWVRGSQDVLPTKVTPELAAEIERLQNLEPAIADAVRALESLAYCEERLCSICMRDDAYHSGGVWNPTHEFKSLGIARQALTRLRSLLPKEPA